jgi:hypothetical protein
MPGNTFGCEHKSSCSTQLLHWHHVTPERARNFVPHTVTLPRPDLNHATWQAGSDDATGLLARTCDDAKGPACQPATVSQGGLPAQAERVEEGQVNPTGEAIRQKRRTIPSGKEAAASRMEGGARIKAWNCLNLFPIRYSLRSPTPFSDGAGKTGRCSQCNPTGPPQQGT